MSSVQPVKPVHPVRHVREARRMTRFRVRLLLLGLTISLSVFAVSARLFHLSVMARDELQARGEQQYQEPLRLDARRGAIRDRNGRELAVSVEVESIYAVPRAFGVDDLRQASKELSRCLGVPSERVAARLQGTKSFAWLERKANPRAVRCVRALNLAGVGFVPESRRFYPKRRLASQILGWVGVDNQGLGGVEFALDEEIRGKPGRRILWTDALKRRAGSWIDEQAEPGRSVYLTLDENLQHIAETELSAAVRESRSRTGIAILMRPHTGEILAMASYPGFNPNRYGDSPESHRRNRSVTDVYEPGSTFKIVAASAALAEGVTTEDERIDCGGGGIQISDRWIRDHRPFDVITFSDVVSRSSNVGMIRIGQRLGSARFEAYIRAFGFGEPTGVELPAESRGILRPASGWSPGTAASIAFGQEVSVTPLQMVAAANVIATSGYLMRPKLVLGYEAEDGSLQRNASPEPVRRVLDEAVAARMSAILVEVVENGTGKTAKIPGVRVAGKTGTAQKAVPGGYSRTDFIASFVGFAPADSPEITALVILDSPEGEHSGSRAAAVFSRIVGRALFHLGVPANDGKVVRFAQLWPQMPPILRGEHPSGAGALREVGFLAAAARIPAVAPEVVGLPARDALVRFVASGLVPEIVGTGLVVEQSPAPGDRLEGSAPARLILGAGPRNPKRLEEPLLVLRREPAVRLARSGRPGVSTGGSSEAMARYR